jgi:S1-C subfamily serine protease
MVGTVSSVELVPVDVRWRTLVALHASNFFSMLRRPELVAEVAQAEVEAGQVRLPTTSPTGGEVRTPWTVSMFVRYLGRRGVALPDPTNISVLQLLDDMRRAGLLYDCGRNPMSSRFYTEAYWFLGMITAAQKPGYLWLCEAVGPGLVIDIYSALTTPVARPGEEGGIGSGLVLDPRHILTNRHVIEEKNIRPGDDLETPRTPPPSLPTTSWEQLPATVSVAAVHLHDDLDVGVIELDSSGAGLNTLPGVVFREPRSVDRAFVFGYPPIPYTVAVHVVAGIGEVVNPRVLSVQSGEVINPAVDMYKIVDGADGYGSETKWEKFFLFTSITRPGNSGGPIVAQDGRVIGLVAHDLPGGQDETPFYRGIPADELLRALGEMNLGHIARFENWDAS